MILSRINNRILLEFDKLLAIKENLIAKSLMKGSKQSIYHLHVPKTAGTTINFAFLSNADTKTDQFYDSISKKHNHRIIKNGKVYVGWNVKLINEGNFSYAFSHKPLHELNLSNNTFKFTCLRDPCNRIISYYNMFKYFEINNINHPSMNIFGKLLGNDFNDFIFALPKEFLLNQIYMFSKEYNINEAHDNLLNLDQIIFTETLMEGLKLLESKVGWNLPISNQKNFGFKELITPYQLNRLREILNPEYELMESLKNKSINVDL
jgi:hypothetical protein